MKSLRELTVRAAARLIAEGRMTSKELVDAAIGAAAISATEDALSDASGMASSSGITQMEMMHPPSLSPSTSSSSSESSSESCASFVEGLPFVVKENIVTRSFDTDAGSKMLKGYRHRHDAAVVSRLLRSGAKLVGKTAMDEFGMGSHSLRHGGTCIGVRNPRNLMRSAGGSSGGTAAAVAAGIALFGIGSDTGGSVRQPAAFCGLCGLKPTYGLIPRDGLIAYASSLDTVGIIAKTVEDTFDVLEVVEGESMRDMTSSSRPATWRRRRPSVREGDRSRDAATSYEDEDEDDESIIDSLKGMRIGLPVEARIDEASSRATQAWEEAADVLRRAGATVVDVRVPMFEKCLAAYHIIAHTEAASNLSRYDGIRYGPEGVIAHAAVRHGMSSALPDRKRELASLEAQVVDMRSRLFGEEVKRRIIMGTFASSSVRSDGWFVHASRVRAVLAEDMRRCFDAGVDVLLTPTVPDVAPLLEDVMHMEPNDMYAGDIYTVPANLAGLPAFAMPAGIDHDTGMPRSIQLIASWYREDKIRIVASVLQRSFLPSFHPHTAPSST